MMYGGIYHGTRARPNANPVLDAMRDDDIAYDPWGTAMAYAFAVCEVLYFDASAPVPEELEYWPAPGATGVDRESWPNAYVADMGLDVYTLTVAARCLSRYLDLCRTAGRDY